MLVFIDQHDPILHTIEDRFYPPLLLRISMLGHFEARNQTVDRTRKLVDFRRRGEISNNRQIPIRGVRCGNPERLQLADLALASDPAKTRSEQPTGNQRQPNPPGSEIGARQSEQHEWQRSQHAPHRRCERGAAPHRVHTRPSSGRGQSIAVATNRDQILRIGRVRFDLLPKSAHMHIDCAGIDRMLVLPHMPQQRFPGKRDIRDARANSAANRIPSV